MSWRGANSLIVIARPKAVAISNSIKKDRSLTAAVFFYFLNKSLCELVRASVNMSVSPEIL